MYLGEDFVKSLDSNELILATSAINRGGDGPVADAGNLALFASDYLRNLLTDAIDDNQLSSLGISIARTILAKIDTTNVIVN